MAAIMSLRLMSFIASPFPGEYEAHYHLERNHQGKGNKLLAPPVEKKGLKIHCHQRLGGLLKFYARAA
jgi:hypothetical protein